MNTSLGLVLNSIFLFKVGQTLMKFLKSWAICCAGLMPHRMKATVRKIMLIIMISFFSFICNKFPTNATIKAQCMH